MKLLFKQRFFSWFDSYDIYYENGAVAYTVEGQPSWGHKLHIILPDGTHAATVKQVILTFLPKYEFYIGGELVGTMQKQFTFLKPSYSIDYNGWSISGSFFEWDYSIVDRAGRRAATISKELFNFTDTYVIDVCNPADALCALMVTLAIDAEKCSRA